MSVYMYVTQLRLKMLTDFHNIWEEDILFEGQTTHVHVFLI